ncbi:hypothetical protein XENTR_v10012722 [Xenopus tropicalis]|nr:hypothetical protein XENTR_v10012722 [Xenopus tropicalis]
MYSVLYFPRLLCMLCHTGLFSHDGDLESPCTEGSMSPSYHTRAEGNMSGLSQSYKCHLLFCSVTIIC